MKTRFNSKTGDYSVSGTITKEHVRASIIGHTELFTDNWVNVSAKVSNDNTFATRNHAKAYAYARENRSYVYSLYELINERLSFWGYAVPK